MSGGHDGRELTAERRGTTLVLTLDRPDKLNALSHSLVEALLEQLDIAEASGVRLLVLEGNGRCFSAGFDFGGFEEQSEGDLLLRFVRIEELLQRLHHAPFDTLALAHGRNFGAGVDIVCACSRRLADPAATFRMPGLSFGLVLGTRRYMERVGAREARRVLQDGVTFDAPSGEAAGFLTACVTRDRWPEAIANAETSSVHLAPDATARLLRATSIDTRPDDMADLVRSASLPGLKERIRAYRRQSAPAKGVRS